MSHILDRLTIRKAELSDASQITALLISCFGHLAIAEGALTYVLDRYYVAVSDTGQIIGLTGIIPEADHNAITFTCTDPHYRRMGIMNAMFDELLKNYTDDKFIVLQAWHLTSRNEANLGSIAEKHGFKLIKQGYVNRIKGITPSCKGCIFSNRTECNCCDDLYIYELHKTAK